MTPRMYSVPEAARLLGLSRRSVIRIFEREPGTVVFERPEEMHKRRYRTIRIPADVLERVMRAKNLCCRLS